VPKKRKVNSNPEAPLPFKLARFASRDAVEANQGGVDEAASGLDRRHLLSKLWGGHILCDAAAVVDVGSFEADAEDNAVPSATLISTSSEPSESTATLAVATKRRSQVTCLVPAEKVLLDWSRLQQKIGAVQGLLAATCKEVGALKAKIDKAMGYDMMLSYLEGFSPGMEDHAGHKTVNRLAQACSDLEFLSLLAPILEELRQVMDDERPIIVKSLLSVVDSSCACVCLGRLGIDRDSIVAELLQRSCQAMLSEPEPPFEDILAQLDSACEYYDDGKLVLSALSESARDASQDKIVKAMLVSLMMHKERFLGLTAFVSALHDMSSTRRDRFKFSKAGDCITYQLVLTIPHSQQNLWS
jgi:hypothetical protein